MKKFAKLFALLASVAVVTACGSKESTPPTAPGEASPNLSQKTVSETGKSTFTGKVERVWEDGFILSTPSRKITVDSWDICGDNTEKKVSVGERLTVTGVFENREFDAFSITNTNQQNICR